MSYPIEFRLALSNSYPSGTGSYNYTGSFQLVVQNIAYAKHVAVWAQIGPLWQEIAATYVESLPGNLELWKAPASNNEDQFVAKYTVNGITYWDNNGGLNYKFPRAFDEFSALSGINYKIIMGSANISGGTLTIFAGVQNLAYGKVVGAVFTTDNWATAQTANGSYSWTMSSGLEVWKITAPVGGATDVKFALFYQVGSGEFWDNNFWRNYTVTPTTPIVALRHVAKPTDQQNAWHASSKKEPEIEPSSTPPRRSVTPQKITAPITRN